MRIIYFTSMPQTDDDIEKWIRSTPRASYSFFIYLYASITLRQADDGIDDAPTLQASRDKQWSLYRSIEHALMAW